MEASKKRRAALRAGLTKALNVLQGLLHNEEATITDLNVAYCTLESKSAALDECQESIFETMLKDASESEWEREYNEADEYKHKFLTAKVKFSEHLSSITSQNSVHVADGVSLNTTEFRQNDSKKSYKLPKLELVKFSGNLRDWLSFWSAFKKIHEDQNLGKDEKFQYLKQTMVPDSIAAKLINSYPSTSANYDHAIQSLKDRFGRDDLQIGVYIRELLQLVIRNTNKSSKVSLSALYYDLQSHLRSLKSLGITTETCSAMLLPLVESSLPAEVLRAWQRSDLSKFDSLDTNKDASTQSMDHLDNLIKFIGSEVRGEERIALAAEGFNLGICDSTKPKKYENVAKHSANQNIRNVPSAVGLLVSKARSNKCLFCDAGNHKSADCEKAVKMNLSERQEIVRKRRACFNCLHIGHGVKECRVPVECTNCKRRHVTLMCRGYMTDTINISGNKQCPKIESTNEIACSLATVSYDPQIFLRIIKVKLRNGDREKVVRTLFDSGSHRSYILKEVAVQMNYEMSYELNLRHLLFGGVQTKIATHKMYQIDISSIDGKFTTNLTILDQDVICEHIPAIENGTWREELHDLGISLTDFCDTEEPVSILFGADVIGKFLTDRRIKLKCGLVAQESVFGWTVIGPISSSVRNNSVCTTMSMHVLNCQVKDLWSLDVLGIRDPIEQKTQKQQQEETMDKFLKTVKLNIENRYEVQLPWNENHPPLGNNKAIAIKRLQSLVKKLKSDGHYQAYNDVFMDWIMTGIIEYVPAEEEGNFGHYLPHRHIIKENSTTVIRPVFDASAKQIPYAALNECLETGPNLIELIPSVLLRFRQGNIGVISDIKKAFLQISIDARDRDFMRFLWLDDHGKTICFRHRRVVFGVCCSPFILMAVINLHLKSILQQLDKKSDDNFSKDKILQLANSFYVDNCVTSFNSEKELNSFIAESKKVMESAGFELRGWEYSKDGSQKSKAAVLGMLWDKEHDVLYLNVANLKHCYTKKVTKRIILSATHQIFDPLGIVCPVILTPRLLLQETWSKRFSWDEEVEENIRYKFEKWLGDLEVLERVRIPRSVLNNVTDKSKISLHTFCDASQVAYAAVAFVRVESDSGTSVGFIQAKTRVAPNRGENDKKHSIPRLELLAATIGVRMTMSIIGALSIKDIKVYYWSDSTTVLAWIGRESNWSTFVHNRVKEIREFTNPKQWHHVPGECNPADLPSRGCTVRQLITSKWWEGPSWLPDRNNWPAEKPLYDETEVTKELKKTTIKTMTPVCSFLATVFQNQKERNPWYMNRFSSYRRVVRVLVWVKRFVHNCVCTLDQRRKGYISFDEIKEAELSLIKIIQSECFLDLNDQRIKHFKPYFDQNVIRINTRLILREDTYSFRCPIILPAYHEISSLIIKEKHIELKHAGVQITMNALREKFWILGGRKYVRSVIRKCIDCRRHESEPLEVTSAPLPIDRVRDAAVFEVIGVDFAGPIFLKGEHKSWICIFTCAVYRAVHFELVGSLNVAGVLMALRRFIARRGRPSVIFSDNGKNFVGLNNALKTVDYEKLSETVALQGIDWKFNPPTASWWGGFWERLIGILKKLLRRTLKKACLDYEEMITVLVDCEAVINSRPITYMADNDNEVLPLTPSHFLLEIKDIGVLDLDQIEHTLLNKRYFYRQSIKDSLRKRFRSEYLGALSYQKKCCKDSKINVGDLVLVGNDTLKRLDWPLARVKELYKGKDGNIRVARLNTANGELIRPIQRIFPLELDCKFSEDLKNIPGEQKIVTKFGSNTNQNALAEKTSSDNNANGRTNIVTRGGRVIKRPDRLIYS